MTTQIEDVVVVIARFSEQHIELRFLAEISLAAFVGPWAVRVAGLLAGLPVELDGLVLVVVPLVGQLAVRTVWAWLLGPVQWMLARAPAQLKEQLFACA